MKSLANPSSFALVHNLRSESSPHVISYLRPDVCFSLRCRKDQLRFLNLVQNNAGVSPLCASEAKVELINAELPGQQTNEQTIVSVKFQFQRKCKFGEQFFMVGDDPLFGSWDPSDAIPMTWSDDHIWTAETDVVAGKTLQYKFILKDRKGGVIWQPGSDRFIQIWETVNGICVFEDWENAELQKITEQQQHQHSNEEYQLEKPSISSSSKSTGRKKVSKNTNRKKEQSAADRPTWINPNGKVTSIKNQETKVADKGRFDVEDVPALAPDFAPSVLPDEESNSGETI